MPQELPKFAVVWMIVAALQFAHIPSYSCGLDFSIPTNRFDGVNERGAVSFWDSFDSVDFGADLKIPLVVNFRSDRNATSPYLGSGWFFALLESHIYQADDQNFVMVQPDGLNRYFYRVKPQDTILRDRGGWAAEIVGDTITAWADCGWKLTYRNGRLISMQTPTNRKLDFIQAGGRISELREGGKTHLKAVTDPSTGLITGLEFNNRRVGIELENRPMVQVLNGQSVVSTMTPSLRRFTGGTSGHREYAFAVDQKLQPNLTISGSPERVLTWNPANRLIVSDTGWEYAVTPGKGVFSNAAIERKNAQGGKESWHFDRARGIETDEGLDGVRRVTTYFTSGLLTGKLRRVEETTDGKTRILRDLSYNEKGQLFREKGADDAVTTFKYDNQDRMTDVFIDGKPLAHRSYDEKNRVQEEEIFGVEKISFRYLPTGGYEKSVMKANGESETLVFDKAEKLIEGAFANGRKVVFESEFVPTVVPSTSEKRDALIKELTDQLSTLKEPIARGDLLIRIGRTHTDDTLGPSDPRSAIEVFGFILKDPTMDDYSKAQAHSWIASKYLEIGPSEWPKGVSEIEQLLTFKGNNLSPDRLNGLKAEQLEGFRKMLALMRTGQPKKDEKIWRAALEKYGSSDEFRQQLDLLLTQQKKEISVQSFNNDQT